MRRPSTRERFISSVQEQQDALRRAPIPPSLPLSLDERVPPIGSVWPPPVQNGMPISIRNQWVISRCSLQDRPSPFRSENGRRHATRSRAIPFSRERLVRAAIGVVNPRVKGSVMVARDLKGSMTGRRRCTHLMPSGARSQCRLTASRIY